VDKCWATPCSLPSGASYFVDAVPVVGKGYDGLDHSGRSAVVVPVVFMPNLSAQGFFLQSDTTLFADFSLGSNRPCVTHTNLSGEPREGHPHRRAISKLFVMAVFGKSFWRWDARTSVTAVPGC